MIWLESRVWLHVVNIQYIWFRFGFPEQRHRHSATHINMKKYGCRTCIHTLIYADAVHTGCKVISPEQHFFFLPVRSLYSLTPGRWLSDPTMAYSWWLLLQLIGIRSQCALIEWPWLYILCWSWTHYFNRPALITIHYKWGTRMVVFSLPANDTLSSLGWTSDCFGQTLYPRHLCCRTVVEQCADFLGLQT